MLTFPRLFVAVVIIVVRAVRALAKSRADLVLEDLALRQQVASLKRERPRPSLGDSDRGLLVASRESWPGWIGRLEIVTPETVVKWHRQRFRRYWTRLSHENRRPGRPRIDAEVRELIRSMALDNGWGAPRIHGELGKLGFGVSEATVSRYMPRLRPDPRKVQGWMTFLRNHEDAIAAMDLFTVPTVRLRVLYRRSPWQNPVAERWIGKDTPDSSAVTPRPSTTATIVALPRVGGLHHRYEWREAAWTRVFKACRVRGKRRIDRRRARRVPPGAMPGGVSTTSRPCRRPRSGRTTTGPRENTCPRNPLEAGRISIEDGHLLLDARGSGSSQVQRAVFGPHDLVQVHLLRRGETRTEPEPGP